MDKKIMDKKVFYIVLIVLLLIVSFFLFYMIGKADTDSNKVAIKNIKITKIDTGSGNFTNDGLNYDDQSSYQKIDGYTPGEDANANNRIVRSFDTLTYHFDFSITGKSDDNDYEERKVDIKVTLPEEISNYVSFSPDVAASNSSQTFTFEGIDTYGSFQKDITLYVLGAPNKTLISPKFEIQESTNTDDSYIVTLGNANTETYYYEYNKDSSNNYSTTSSVNGFTNYMPTVVSSKKANINFKLLAQQTEGQKATYNNAAGRYLTYVLAVEMLGSENTGIKGYTMPNKDGITFNIATTSSSSTSPTIENDWVRNYGNDSINGIESIVLNIPYSSTSIDINKRAKFPGNIAVDNNKATISNYDIVFSPVVVNADNTKVSNNEYIIGTYAFTVFSPRSTSDGKNDINTTLTLSDINVKDVDSSNITVNNVSATAVNKYYESSDYSLTSEIDDLASNKITSISKGTTVKYKTTFKYRKALSDQGLKEIIKVDTNAYRVVPISDNEDINIIINGDNISKDDFEIKYLSGDFNSNNYSSNTSFDKISEEEKSLVTSACSTVSSNLNTYSVDQIMNLYGGPCIKANDNTEMAFNKIIDAKAENKEVPISKVIVQTKKGVVLPDNVEIVIEVGIRVRNVSDLTQNYQITSVASSSDYDNFLTYYSPRLTNDENSITSPNNYRKTIYKGKTISYEDIDSPWGASLKIVNFTSRQTISVTNKNTDGSMKTSYNINKGETITYNIKTNIEDQNQVVGADDAWYINNLKVRVTLPNTLTYVEDKNLGTPEVYDENGNTILVYTLPFTKPNIKINDINFKAIIKSNLKGSAVPITITSVADAININGEIDTSYYGEMISSFTIYATGIENVIVSQKNDQVSVVEKNAEFSYLLSAYNNTNSNIVDYSIVDILPSKNDSNGSNFDGSYKVKVTLPSSLAGAKVYCSTMEYSKLANEVNNDMNKFEECNITEGFVDATAIKITDIKINSNESIEDIKVTLKPTGNNYENKYINSFVGASKTYSQNESNKIEVRVVSRNISGRIFLDNNENGVRDNADSYLENIPLTIYKLDSLNNETKIEDVVTDSNGYYIFKNLDVGRYKIKASYDKNKYDLTLRYAIEDTSIDSDAYKVEEGRFEITNTKAGVMANTSGGIRLTREIESISNMDVGLIPRKTFGFEINKFITKVDLTYNNTLESYDYKNEKLVKIDVRNSLNAYVKVYYGIQIINNSTTAGYVKLINESIPVGASFDDKDPINSGWFYTNGELQNVSLENDLIAPGETRNLQIALNIPPQTEYRSYVNTVTLLDIAQYEKEELSSDTNAESNLYNLGESLTYAGVDWHVINVSGSNDDQILTLLADSSNLNVRMGHTSSSSSTYKWSESLINKYINNDYVATNTLNTPILYDNSICDDASGLPVASYGGTLASEGKCQSNIYNSYKVRLLTEDEYNKLLNSNLDDLTWLYGNNDFWLENSVYVDQTKDVYGRIDDATIVKNLAKYVSKSTTSIKDGYNEDTSKWVYSSTKKEIRPVITISNKNIIAE